MLHAWWKQEALLNLSLGEPGRSGWWKLELPSPGKEDLPYEVYFLMSCVKSENPQMKNPALEPLSLLYLEGSWTFLLASHFSSVLAFLLLVKKFPSVSIKQFTTETVLILKIHGPRRKCYKHSLALTGPPGMSMLQWFAFWYHDWVSGFNFTLYTILSYYPYFMEREMSMLITKMPKNHARRGEGKKLSLLSKKKNDPQK